MLWNVWPWRAKRSPATQLLSDGFWSQKNQNTSRTLDVTVPISDIKTDYGILIRDVDSLKSEVETVTSKVDRAESQLNSLRHESERWQRKNRQAMFDRWKRTRQISSIEYHEDLGIVESLSTGKQRVSWQSEGLPGDTLSMENRVMLLDHAVYYSLVFDPSDNVIQVLMQKHEKNNIQKTKFQRQAIICVLWNGTIGSRWTRHWHVPVRVGSEDILFDYSPNFWASVAYCVTIAYVIVTLESQRLTVVQ
jgi:hypothetical protein